MVGKLLSSNKLSLPGMTLSRLGIAYPRVVKLALCWCAGLVCLVLCVEPLMAADDHDARRGEPMRPYGPVDENGVRVLWLEGGISGEEQNDKGAVIYRGSAVEVSAALRRRNYDEVWLNSGGGSVAQGYEIGALLNEVRATVRVPAREDVLCASSCTNMMLGGYNRIIEPGSSFIIHASSGMSGLEEQPLVVINCNTANEKASCELLGNSLRATFLECGTMDAINDYQNDCVFGATDTFMVVKVVSLSRLDRNMTVLPFLAEAWQASEVVKALEMIQYYQLMLNDNVSANINYQVYRSARNITLQSVYGTGNEGWRSLAEDRLEIQAAGFLAWQELLTQIELGAKSQVVEQLTPMARELGRGGLLAVRIFDATISCRIQNSCYLDQHQARNLGYHNFDE